MAIDNDYVEIYRAYSPERLATVIARMQEQMDEGETFTSQATGDGKQHTVDLNELKKRLQAAQRVQNERANPRGGNGSFAYDFR